MTSLTEQLGNGASLVQVSLDSGTELIGSHARRLLGFVPDGAFDVTFSQMVLAQKLTSFAWNVHDGRQKLEVGPSLVMGLTNRISTRANKL